MGRNHHSVGFGVISEQATGFPGYNSIIPKDKVTVGRILKENGYSTSWFGKNHNTPAFAASQAGPFDQWPVGMGFDIFMGSSVEMPINGSRIFSETLPKFTPMWVSLVGI